MLHVYKIDSVTMVSESMEEILENEGRPLFEIVVKNIIYYSYFQNRNDIFDDCYEGGWPVLFENGEVGFCLNDYSVVDFDGVKHLEERPMDRHFFIRADYKNQPKTGSYFTFLNQYDKRVSNEELEEVLKSCEGDETDITFEIGKDNKLHKTEC